MAWTPKVIDAFGPSGAFDPFDGWTPTVMGQPWDDPNGYIELFSYLLVSSPGTGWQFCGNAESVDDNQASQCVPYDKYCMLAPCVRLDGSGDDASGYMFIMRGNPFFDSYIYRVDAGILTSIASGGSVYADYTILRLEAIGDQITAYANGIQVLTATDSTYPSGMIGFGAAVGAGNMGFGPYRGYELVNGSTPNLTGWTKRKAIKYTDVLPNDDMDDYPLLVKIDSDADIADELSSGGGITFTSDDGETEVPFALYTTTDLASGTVNARVKFNLRGYSNSYDDPSVEGQVIGYLYYDASKTTTEDKAGTVSEFAGFFVNDSVTSTPDVNDWTGNGNDLSTVASGTTGVAAAVGYGVQCDANDEGVQNTGITSDIKLNPPFSYGCIYQNLGSMSDHAFIFGTTFENGSTQPWIGYAIMGGYATSNGKLRCFHSYGTGNDYIDFVTDYSLDTVDDPVSLAAVVTTIATNTDRVYWNGVAIPTPITVVSDVVNYGSYSYASMGEAVALSRTCNGIVEECWVKTGDVGTYWLQFKHKNDLDNANTFALGSEEVFDANASLDQESFRFRYDDGDEGSATWIAAENTGVTMPTNTNVRIRILSNASGDLPTKRLKIQYRKVGDTDWRDVNVP